MTTTDLVARAEALKAEILQSIKDTMRKHLDENPELTWIEWRQVPNSYSDEGYFEEGNVVLHSDDLDEKRGNRFYPGDACEAQSGVYSQDDEYGYYETDEFEDDKWYQLAKVIYNEIDQLGATRNMIGEQHIRMRQ